MTDKRCLWAIIPAAGGGSRFSETESLYSGAAISAAPKQYSKILGKTILAHSIDAVMALDSSMTLMLALASDDRWWQNESLSGNAHIEIVEGGAQRSDSVLSGLKALEGRASADDWVLVHDAARPCLRTSDVHSLLSALAGHKVGGLLAAPIVDTVKRSDSEGMVEATMNRENLYQAQTPQVFRYAVLCEALQSATDQGLAVTDESDAVERLGYQPLLHPGDRGNIKITYQSDLLLAQAYLQAQSGNSE